MSIEKFLYWCEWGIYSALCLAILLLGIGRLEFGFRELSISAWSVSRTTFGFWVLWKLVFLYRRGWPRVNRAALLSLAPLASFFTIVTLSLLPDFRSPGDYRYLVFAFAHALMVVDVFVDAGQQRRLLLIMGVAPLVLVLRGFIDAPEIFHFALSYRFDYPSDHPNTAGYMLAMSIPLCLCVVQSERGWWRCLAALSCLGQIVALLLTYSRGAWLGWIVAMFFFGVATRQWKYLIVTLVIAVTCVAALPSLRERVSSVVQPGIDASLSERLQFAGDAFRLGVNHPILGVGYGRGRLKDALRRSHQGTDTEKTPISTYNVPIHTHNVYLELFAETGLLGVGAFLWLIVSTLRRLLRRAFARATPDRLAGVALATALVAAAVAGLGDVPFYHHGPRVFLFSLFALAHLYCRDTDKEYCEKKV